MGPFADAGSEVFGTSGTLTALGGKVISWLKEPSTSEQETSLKFETVQRAKYPFGCFVYASQRHEFSKRKTTLEEPLTKNTVPEIQPMQRRQAG